MLSVKSVTAGVGRRPLTPHSPKTPQRQCVSKNVFYQYHKLPCFQNKGLKEFLTNSEGKFDDKECPCPIGFLYYAPNRISMNASINYIIQKDGIWNLRNSVKILRHRDNQIECINSWSMTFHCLVNEQITSAKVDENGDLVTIHQSGKEIQWNRDGLAPNDPTIVRQIY